MKQGAWMTAAATLAALLASGAGTAQQQPSSLPGVFGEVLDVRVVNLEVVVTDRDGVPVVGLAPEDFLLRVDGEETAIEYFTEIRAGSSVEGPRGEVTSPPAVAPGERVSTSYLVFIDDYFAITRDRNQVLDALIADLPRLGPEDRMAVVAYDGDRLEMLSTWSSSVPALERSLQKAKTRPADGLKRIAEQREFDFDRLLQLSSGIREGTFSSDDFLRTYLNPEERFYVERLTSQVERSVTAAASTLRSFAEPPGRKVMLLLSGGWPYLPASFLEGNISPVILYTDVPQGPALFRPLTDTANLLGYTIYPVDVPGFNQASTADASVASVTDISTLGSGAPSGFLREQEIHFSLQFVAGETGGRPFLNGARLEALDRAVSDTRSYYWIGFSPSRGWDDRRHDIGVEIRSPDFRVRARESFLDSSRQHEVTMAVESALLFGNPPSEESIRVRLGNPKKAGRGRMAVEVEVLIPLQELTFLPTADGNVAELELRIAVLDDQGQRAEIPILPITMTTDEDPSEGSYGRYETTLKLRRRAHEAVFAVFDPASGRIFSTSEKIVPRL